MARIGRQFTAGADQEHVHRFAQTGKLALIVKDDGLNAGALGNGRSSQDLPPPELA